MDSLERDSIQLIQRLLELYLNRQAPEELLSLLDEEIEFIGTGRHEVLHGLPELCRHLEMESSHPQKAYSLLDLEADAKTLAPGLCLALGSLSLRSEDWVPHAPDLSLRFSMLFRQDGQGGLRLFQLHLSTPSLIQEEEEVFPTLRLERNPILLRQMLDQQSQELQDRNRDLDALTNNVPGGVISCDCSDQLNLLQFSDGFCTMFGYTREDILKLFGGQFIRMLCPEDREIAWRSARDQLAQGNSKELEYRIRRKDGSLVWVLDRGQMVIREDGSSCFYCILIDITQNKRVREELRMSLERHQVIMDQTNDVIFEWDIRSDSIHFSPNWEKKFGYKPISGDLTGQIVSRAKLHPDDLETFLQMMCALKSGTPYCETEFRIIDREGRYRWFRVRATLQVGGDGLPAQVVGVIIDIDQEKRRTQKLLERAERDTLTGLYNKGTAQTMMESVLQEDGNSSNALMIIDVDNFKQINDIFGHLGGDAILMDISSALQSLFREYDIVGRVGGDEFCVLMRGVKNHRTVTQKAQSILEAFRDLLDRVEGHHLSCSVGIALAPRDGQDFLSLFRNADLALYHAKQKGKDGYQFFSPSLLPGDSAARPAMPRTAVGGAIDSDQNANSSAGNRLAQYIFHVLYHSAGVAEAIPLILEIVGKQFDVSRVYIFELGENEQAINNTFEWCNIGVTSEIRWLQDIPCANIAPVLDTLRNTGAFYCKDVSALTGDARSLLERQNIKSVLLRAIWDGGRFRGMVGFDECRRGRFWTQEQVDALSFIAEIVSTFLLKERAQVRTSQVLQSLCGVLDNQENWIYVIDSDTHLVLYANRSTQELLPHLRAGETLCHQIFFGSPTPCANCPLRDGAGGHGPGRAELHSQVLNKSVLAKITPISWPGVRKACLFSCQELLP